MIVCDFNALRTARRPSEADPELVIDPDTMLAAPIGLQRFETVAWWYEQILQRLGRVQGIKLPSSHDMQSERQDFARSLGGSAIENVLRGRVREGLNHAES
jgi:hypothetical protein